MIAAARREAFEAELDEIAKVMRTGTLPLSNALVDKHISLHDRIMLHGSDRWRGKSGHYRRYRDDGGWYVRMAKRGTIKRYLDRCEVTLINGEPTLFQYRLRKEG